MTSFQSSAGNLGEFDGSDALFEKICIDLEEKGFSINPTALPSILGDKLLGHLTQIEKDKFDAASIGRNQALMLNNFVRADKISWISGDSAAGRDWLSWAAKLQRYLNRELFLGLFSFESHFAHYPVGGFYKRHLDAFKGEANRRLSIVVYLNPDWALEQGGELVLYTNESKQANTKVTPSMGTVVVFLSEDFPHEVKITQRDRYSIAGWFRVNTSKPDRVDPPS